MVENPKRSLIFVLILIALSATAWQVFGFRLGLDLKGGARLVYSVDIAKAKAEGQLDKNVEPQEVMKEMLTIISQRIDPKGVLDASITIAGTDQLLIELPGTKEEELASIMKRIQELGLLEMRMVCQGDHPEWTYDKQEEDRRLKAFLAAPENKDLIAADPLKIFDRFNNKAGTDKGPKSKNLSWYPVWRIPNPNWKKGSTEPKFLPHEKRQLEVGPDNDPEGKGPYFLPLDMAAQHFTGEHLNSNRVGASTDKFGAPALSYEFRADYTTPYADWTEKHKDYASAISLNRYVRVAPVIQGRIYGGGQITGAFTDQEVKELVIVLKTGSLKVAPKLESKATVGASLGAIAIQKGTLSLAMGGLLVLLFMLLYYRQSGLIAVISLLANMSFVIGMLTLIKATITLPGLAGLVLTIGMAVDANILIYERIREEQDKGKDLIRSIEAGFEKAFSTIVDANLTTFITGLILYNVGIGPIKGFAVTLMLGIVTSVFSALFVSKVFFTLFYGEKKEGKLHMSEFLGRTKIHFLRYRLPTALLSVVMVAGGLTLFGTTPEDTKYGIDFTGGAQVRVALREGMTQGELKQLLSGKVAGPPQAATIQKFTEEFPSIQITTIGDPIDGMNRGFAIKLKLTAAQRKALKASKAGVGQSHYVGYLSKILSDKLALEPFDIVSKDVKNGEYDLRIHALANIDRLALKAKLIKATGINVPEDPKAVQVLDDDNKIATDQKSGHNFLVQLTLAGGTPPDDVPLILAEGLKGLKDIKGQPVELSSAFPEDTTIGSRAVGELRERALLAMILALACIIIYIRIRFHEYSYGIAATVALVHDVCITLGFVVLFNKLGLVHAEIDLSLIAAFLTIIGYSLNDTIVVFDRIRENLELEKKLGAEEGGFEGLVDRSVNENLSRTILTSVTTFLAVAVIFFINRGVESVLEGFAFAMCVGVIVGTYSSIFVANPVVVMLQKRAERKAKAKGSDGSSSGTAVTATSA